MGQAVLSLKAPSCEGRPWAPLGPAQSQELQLHRTQPAAEVFLRASSPAAAHPARQVAPYRSVAGKVRTHLTLPCVYPLGASAVSPSDTFP